MATILAHIRLHEGRERDFEEVAARLFAAKESPLSDRRRASSRAASSISAP